MTESTYSEFVHGKLVGSTDSGYQLVARTVTLPEGIDPDEMARQYSFWGSTPPLGEHWAIALICRGKELMLVKKEMAVGSNGHLAVSGCRNFDTARYLFVPLDEIKDKASSQSFQLLDWMYQEPIETHTQPNHQLNPLTTFPLDSTVAAIAPKALDSEDPSILVWRSLQIKSPSGDALLLQALSAILAGKRLLLGFGKSDRDLGKSLLLLLPAACRHQISIAMGTVEESFCQWAQLIIKRDPPSRYGKQAENLLQVNTTTGQLSGHENFSSQRYAYIEILKTMLQTPEQSKLLLQQLNIANYAQLSLDSLIQPYLLPPLAIQLGRLQPAERLDEHLRNHLSHLDNSQWLTLLPQMEGRELMFAWSHIFSKATTNAQAFIPLLYQIWLRFSEEQKVDALGYFQVAKHPELVSDWITTALLEHSALADDGSRMTTAWRILCQQFIPAQVQRSWEIALHLTTSLSECEEFGAGDRFWLFDSMLEKVTASEKVDFIFNRFLAPLLPHISELETSHLYRHLSSRSETVKKTLQLIVKQGLEALSILPELATITHMTIEHQDAFYTAFLRSHQPTFEQSKPLFESLLQKKMLLSKSALGTQLTLAKTIGYYCQALPDLEPALKDMQEGALSWSAVDAFVGLLRDRPDQKMAYADQLITLYDFSHLRKPVIVSWLNLIACAQAESCVFQEKSQIWKSMSPTEIAQLATMPQIPIETLVHELIQGGKVECIPGSVLHQLIDLARNSESTTGDKAKSTSSTLLTLIDNPKLTRCYTEEDWLTLARELWLCDGEGIVRSRPTQLSPTNQQRLQAMAKERICISENPEWLTRILTECEAWHFDQDAMIELLLSASAQHCSTTLVQLRINAVNPHTRSDELARFLLKTQPTTEADREAYKGFLVTSLRLHTTIETAPAWLRDAEEYAHPELYRAALMTVAAQRITCCIETLKQEMFALMRYTKEHKVLIGQKVTQQLSEVFTNTSP